MADICFTQMKGEPHMDSAQKASVTSRIRNSKGFTLIEMAIVLVIIGIIIGAVVKGQDLVDNAKSKQFASKLQAWQVALNTYYDRTGRYPGDVNKDGVIASSSDTLTPLDDINSASFTSAPETSFTLGGASFAVKLGNDGQTPPSNYLVVCKDDTCSSKYDPTNSNDLSALKYFEAYDTAIDGSADPTTGNVKGYATVGGAVAGAKYTSLTTPATTASWLDAANNISALAYKIK